MSYLDFFYEIAKVPRPSFSCGKIADYLCDFAEKRGLSFVRDGADNVIIKKNATAGYEDSPAVMLQGHTDMVWCVAEGRDIDAENGVTVVSDGEWLRADGTTLGADNGIAMTYMLDLLDRSDIAHPALECVFTSDEEVGLIGAAAIDLSESKAKYLLNMDSEEEGILTAGCCGGLTIEAKFRGEKTYVCGDVYRLSVKGLRGGHSGVHIDSGRTNAIKALNHILRLSEENISFRLVDYTAGEKDNAIPKSASFTFCGGNIDLIRDAMDFVKEGIMYDNPGVASVTLEKISCDGAECFSREFTENMVGFISACPNGVLDRLIDWTPTISDNIAVLRTEGDEISVTVSFRAYDDAYRDRYSAKVIRIAEQCGGSVRTYGVYPGWNKSEESPIRDKMCQVWKDMTGEDMKVEMIHAGLECGVLTSKCPQLDAVSFGPDLQDVHTVDEKLSLASAEKCYNFIVRLLAELK